MSRKTHERNMAKLARSLRKKLLSAEFSEWDKILEDGKHHILEAIEQPSRDSLDNA